MDETDNDRPIGVPVTKLRSKSVESPQLEPMLRATRSVIPEPGRHPDDELGLAKQLPRGMHAPTEQELAAVLASEEIEARRLYSKSMQSGLSHFSLWGRWIDRTLLVSVLAIAALLSLFVFSQTLQVLAVVAVQPLPIQVIAYAGLIVIFAILAVFTIRLAMLLRRLRVNQQISAVQLREISCRAELRALAEQDMAAAKKQLEDYLRDYPFDQFRDVDSLGSFQLNETSVKRLKEARDFLLDHERFSDYEGWLDDFHVRFQDVLRDAGNQIVHDWMKLVGIKTALSPYALVDSVVVIYCGYGMIADLCRLYNLRMTQPGIIRLLAFTLFNAYAAGEVEDHTKSIADMVGMDSWFDAAHLVGGGLMGKVLLPKAAQGMANALLAYKLGHTTISLLSPISPR